MWLCVEVEVVVPIRCNGGDCGMVLGCSCSDVIRGSMLW